MTGGVVSQLAMPTMLEQQDPVPLTLLTQTALSTAVSPHLVLHRHQNFLIFQIALFGLPIHPLVPNSFLTLALQFWPQPLCLPPPWLCLFNPVNALIFGPAVHRNGDNGKWAASRSCGYLKFPTLA